MDYEIFIRFLLAVLWGGIVGIERQYRGKSAGFRTVIMISIGSCFFTMMSIQIGGIANPDRIASNIVTGIGFLGAGVIFRGDNHINGITTAATVWAVAAVGMGIGGGYYFAAGYASLLIMIVLTILPRIEIWIDRLNQTKEYSIKCSFFENATNDYQQLMKKYGLKYALMSQLKDGKELSLVYEVQGNAKSHALFVEIVLKNVSITHFGY